MTTVSGVGIRPATQADMPSVADIYGYNVEHGLASFELEPPSAEEMTRRFGALRDRGYPYIVAEKDGRIVGYAYAGPYRTRPAYRYSVENSVYVAPDTIRRGIGGQLLGRIIELAGEAGFRQMIAIIGDSGNVSSIELHRAFGFRPVGTLENVGLKHGRWVDSVILQRPLGESGDTLPETSC